MADAAAFTSTCRRYQVPVTVERSRSGNGAHIWLFFDRPVLAAKARQLGCALLTRTMESRHEIGLDSYDRLFPSQDTLPKGGFGIWIRVSKKFKSLKMKDLAPRARFELATLRLTAGGCKL